MLDVLIGWFDLLGMVVLIGMLVLLLVFVVDIDFGMLGDLLCCWFDVVVVEVWLYVVIVCVGVVIVDLFLCFMLLGLFGSVMSSYGFFCVGSDMNLIVFGIDWLFFDVGCVCVWIVVSDVEVVG